MEGGELELKTFPLNAPLLVLWIREDSSHTDGVLSSPEKGWVSRLAASEDLAPAYLESKAWGKITNLMPLKKNTCEKEGKSKDFPVFIGSRPEPSII